MFVSWVPDLCIHKVWKIIVFYSYAKKGISLSSDKPSPHIPLPYKIIKIITQLLVKKKINNLYRKIPKYYKLSVVFQIFCGRANRDKENLEHKLRKVQIAGPGGRETKKESTSHSHKAPATPHNIEELRRRNYELEEQVSLCVLTLHLMKFSSL